jgi:hypothetical protein
MTKKNDKTGPGRESSQFRTGQPSANPKGRPKGSGNVKGYIRAELGKTVKVRIEGRDRKLPKAKVVAMRAVERGMRGENQATNRLIDIDGSNDEEQVVSLAEQQREDQLIMERFVERLRARIRREEGL